MVKFRNFLIFSCLFFLLYINISYIRGENFTDFFYLLTLNIALCLTIFVEVIYAFNLEKKIREKEKEISRLKLTIKDFQTESFLLNTVISLIETGKWKVEEIIETTISSLKQIFKDDIIIIHLFGGRFLKKVVGDDIIPFNELENIVSSSKPLLVNNTSSFKEFKILNSKGITSLIVVPLTTRKQVIGVLGVFSKKGKNFTPRDLELLRIISVPVSLIIENAELLEKTEFLSITDFLTSLYNRRFFEEKLEEIFLKSKSEKKKFSLAIADVDYFKFYNDNNGHPLGDIVLKKVAEIIKSNVKGGDIVARYGGEEFAIIFPDTGKEGALVICEKIRKKIKEYKFPYEQNQPNGDLTVSFGVATFPDDALTPEELLKKADFALYKAKEMGKDRVVTV